MDHFCVGRNASTELDIRLFPSIALIEIRSFSPTSSYSYFAFENHSWFCFHIRGDVMRHPYPSIVTSTPVSFGLFGRRQVSYRGSLIESQYWLDIPGFLPVVAAITGLGAIWFHRKSRPARGRAGFPLDVNERSRVTPL
jgi:hypothetical protein